MVTTVATFPTEVTIPNKFALVELAAATNAVVAKAVVLSPTDCVTPIVPVGKLGVPVSVGEAFITKVFPVPVCDATEVAFPELVIGPVKSALTEDPSASATQSALAKVAAFNL